MRRDSSRILRRAPCCANLKERGLIVLPPRQRGAPHSRRAKRQIEPVLHATDGIEQALQEIGPVRLELVADGPSRDLFAHLLHAYHYLSYSRPVGQNLAFLIRDGKERPLGCLLFGAAAWKCAGRDGFIGWDGPSRARHLPQVANNTRFFDPALGSCRAPGQPCSGSGRAAGVSALWEQKYGHPIHLLETFVERERFAHGLRGGELESRSERPRDAAAMIAPPAGSAG